MSIFTRSTIKDVARLAGVSVGTVSRVINASGPVATATAELVRSVIEELGFRPDAAGRSLRLGVSRSIGVLVPTVSNPIFARSLEGIEQAATAGGFSTIVATSRYDRDTELDVVVALVARGVRGLILTLADTDEARLDAVERLGVPFVLVYNQPTGPRDPARFALTTVDSRAAVREATLRLIDLGHRRIAFLGGDFASSDRSKARYEGYRDAMLETGLPVWEPTQVPFRSDGEAFDMALAQLIDRLAAPTALICSNDLLGLQVIAAARRIGLDVPRDLSVLGFDGMPMARLVEPTLATIKQPALSMGAAAVELLFGMFEGGARRQIVLPHEFWPGGTLAAARTEADPMRAGSAPHKPTRSPS